MITEQVRGFLARENFWLVSTDFHVVFGGKQR